MELTRKNIPQQEYLCHLRLYACRHDFNVYIKIAFDHWDSYFLGRLTSISLDLMRKDRVISVTSDAI